jgi:hypothetical protein
MVERDRNGMNPYGKKETDMRARAFLHVAFLAALVTVAAGPARASAMDKMKDEKVAVGLSPAAGVKSAGSGEATFELRGDALHYKLRVKDTENATMAHVHVVGDDGTPAAVLVWLFPSTSPGPGLKAGMFTGTLAEGDITADKLTGPMKGGSVKELFEKLEYGKAGVAVHTKQNPKLELWGVHKGQGKM